MYGVINVKSGPECRVQLCRDGEWCAEARVQMPRDDGRMGF